MNPRAIFTLTRPNGRVFHCLTAKSWRGNSRLVKLALITALIAAFLINGCASAPQAPAAAQATAQSRAVTATQPMVQDQKSVPTLTTLPTQVSNPVQPAAQTQAPAVTWPLTLTAPDGHTVTLAGPAQRIVSLAPTNTETIFAVGAGGQVVGDTTYCDYPDAAAKITKIGGFSADSISIETIVALKPDLVLANGTDQDTVIKALEDAKINVLPLKTTSFGDVYTNIRLAGQVSGHDAEAAALITNLQARVAAVQAKIAGVAQKDRPTVFWEIWDQPLMTAGPSSFIGQTIQMAGGENIFADLSGDYPTVSTEEVVKRQPSVIMGPDTHGDKLTAAQLAARPGWAILQAVKDNKIYLIDGDISSRAGPRLVDALEIIAKDLYPDKFN
jgi:iron complex transport system substrate-binding protein